MLVVCSSSRVVGIEEEPVAVPRPAKSGQRLKLILVEVYYYIVVVVLVVVVSLVAEEEGGRLYHPPLL